MNILGKDFLRVNQTEYNSVGTSFLPVVRSEMSGTVCAPCH